MEIAAANGSDDVVEAVGKLVDLANQQAAQGLAHAGVIKTGLALTTGDLRVYHGLGRVPSIVLATMLSASAAVFVGTPDADPRNYVNVKASAPVTANVLVA